MVWYARDYGRPRRQMYHGGSGGRYDVDYNRGYDAGYRRGRQGYGGDYHGDRRGTYYARGYDESFGDQLRGGWSRLRRGVQRVIGRGGYNRGR